MRKALFGSIWARLGDGRNRLRAVLIAPFFCSTGGTAYREGFQATEMRYFSLPAFDQEGSEIRRICIRGNGDEESRGEGNRKSARSADWERNRSILRVS